MVEEDPQVEEIGGGGGKRGVFWTAGRSQMAR